MRRLKKQLWPYKVQHGVDDTDIKIDKIEQWLRENVGAFKSQWNAVYLMNYTDYYFQNGKDATMFALKWL